MRKLLAALIAAGLWCGGTALVLAQQPFFFPIPLGKGARTQAGTIAIDPTQAAITLNCAGGGGSITSCQTTSAYTAATNNEFLIVFASCNIAGSSVASVSDNGPGLVWTKRASVSAADNAGYASVWYAQASGAFTAKATANYSGCSGLSAAIVVLFGIQNVVIPPDSWDVNVSLPALSTGSGLPATTGPISTTVADTLLLSFEHGIGGTTTNAPTGWTAAPISSTLINFSGNTDSARIDYRIVSTTQTALNATYTGSGSQNWGTIGDALVSQ
jgi:hypothetical protein